MAPRKGGENRKQQATRSINESRLLGDANRICRRGLSFLSGTVSPTRANQDTMDIECVKSAFEHYSKRGIERVICQVKDMGSRGTAYIRRDIEKSFFASRSGVVFKYDRHPALKELMQARIDYWYGEGRNAELELVIEDGELLPWALIGKGLIDRSFRQYVELGNDELCELQDLGFDRAVEMTIDKIDESSSTGKKQLSLLQQANQTEHEFQEMAKFSEQVEIFGNEGEAAFKPFNILKMVYSDGREEVMMDKNEANYARIGCHDYIVLNASEWDCPEFHEWHEAILEAGLEGFMIKPAVYDRELQASMTNHFAPYMKVRNKDYLRLIYGYDYRNPVKLERLVKGKFTGGKVRSSIKQYELGRALLEIPQSKLMAKNDDYFQTVLEILKQFEYDTALDPRL